MKKITIILLFVLGAAQAEDIFTNEFELLVASRLSGMTLKDPHLFDQGLGCTDYTGFLNDFLINSPFVLDGDGDSFLDLNLLLQFKTDQANYLVTKNLEANMVDANCPDPLFSGPCLIDQVEQTGVMTSFDPSNICLEPNQGGLVFDQGLQMGFVSEATALMVEIPKSIPILGGSTLYDLLPGGGSCSLGDDRDTGPDGETSGWWFYFNTASDLVELHVD